MVRVPPRQANAYVSDEFETVRIRADLKEKIMARNSLQTFIERVRPMWGPLSSEVVAGCRHHLEEFLKAPPTEAWLAALHRDAPAYAELYRDPTHGFVLLAHAEYAGLYRYRTRTAGCGS
jgi:hypothetical protein